MLLAIRLRESTTPISASAMPIVLAVQLITKSLMYISTLTPLDPLMILANRTTNLRQKKSASSSSTDKMDHQRRDTLLATPSLTATTLHSTIPMIGSASTETIGELPIPCQALKFCLTMLTATP